MANEIMNIQEQGNALALTTQEQIQAHIYTIRGMQVMLDKDLAVYYGITTSALNQAVKRNADRFPDDFMFQLTKEELQSILMSQNVMSSLKSQNVILESEKDFQNVTSNWGGTRKLPYAFTETGVSSLASVLRGPRASQTHVMIMRAFVAMRRYLTANAGVLQRLDQVEIRQLQSQRQTEQWVTEVNQRFDQILDRLDDGSLKAKMGVFFDQQMFDANVLVEESDLTRKGVVAKNTFTLNNVFSGSPAVKVTEIQAGYYYDLNVTLNPDYLYVLAEHDNKHITIN